jgi:O-antigen biosynthesis protein
MLSTNSSGSRPNCTTGGAGERPTPPNGAALVSCVMATRNRPQFVRRALNSFARQTYTPSELIVVDDSDDPVEHLCDAPSVRYIRRQGRMPLGAKMNLGIEQAAGDYIVKWDDDDWYHPEFNATMLQALLGSANPNRTLAACGCFLVFIAGETTSLRSTKRGLTAGGTFTFTKDLWRVTRFRAIGLEEDYWFRIDSGAEVVRVEKPGMYVVVRHGGNTWVKSRDGRRVIDDVLRALPISSITPYDVFSREELEFYLSLTPLSA